MEIRQNEAEIGRKGETVMPTKVQAQMTALETRFEEELTTVIPGWHDDLEKIQHSQSPRLPKETAKDKVVEESMILGV